MLRAETEDGVWSVLPAVREANDLIRAYKASGHKEPSTFLRQVNMQSGKAPTQTASQLAIGIFGRALGDNKSTFIGRFKEFASCADLSAENNGFGVGKPYS